MEQAELLQTITTYYVESRHFNGYPMRDIIAATSEVEAKGLISKLINAGLLSIVFGNRHPNPYIRALPDEPIPDQLSKFERMDLAQACAYPTAMHLEAV